VHVVSDPPEQCADLRARIPRQLWVERQAQSHWAAPPLQMATTSTPTTASSTTGVRPEDLPSAVVCSVHVILDALHSLPPTMDLQEWLRELQQPGSAASIIATTACDAIHLETYASPRTVTYMWHRPPYARSSHAGHVVVLVWVWVWVPCISRLAGGLHLTVALHQLQPWAPCFAVLLFLRVDSVAQEPGVCLQICCTHQWCVGHTDPRTQGKCAAW
jgi:hypothetical protein